MTLKQKIGIAALALAAIGCQKKPWSIQTAEQGVGSSQTTESFSKTLAPMTTITGYSDGSSGYAFVDYRGARRKDGMPEGLFELTCEYSQGSQADVALSTVYVLHIGERLQIGLGCRVLPSSVSGKTLDLTLKEIDDHGTATVDVAIR